MDKKLTGIISYITLIGWIVAYCAGDKEGAKFHLNQSLVILIASTIWNILTSIIAVLVPILGAIMGALGIVFTVLWVLGLIYACQEQEKEIPVIGSFKILK